jgi:hypothetical protein
MRKRTLLAFALAALALGRGGAVEIYRIGGEDLPRPSEAGVNFHQLSWSDFEEEQSLDTEALAAGMLRPIFLTPATNIALTSPERNGGPYVRVSGVASYSITDLSKTMIDADPATFWEWVAGIQSRFTGQRYLESRRVTMDLGGLFFVNRVRVVAAESGLYPDGLYVSADLGVQKKDTVSGYGAARVGGQLVFELPENVQDTIDVSFPPALARSVGLLLLRASPKALHIGEVEVYGVGYAHQASYVSPFIDLGEPAVWGDIRWRGRQDPRARVWIQSRAGKDLDPNVYWRFTGRGDEVTSLDEEGQPLDATDYLFLKPGEAGEITYDIDNWSFWSSPYAFADSSGTAIASPGPNSVLQLRVDFLPVGSEGGEVEFIELSATKPPLAEQVLGEIYPPEVPLGEIASFRYAIQPIIRAQHSGFDGVEIDAPFGVASVDSVQATGLDSFIVHIAPDSLRFAVSLFPPRTSGDSGGVIEVFFCAPVLRYGTTFRGWVRDSQRPLELAQPINRGDAASEIVSEVLTVRTSISRHLLDDIEVQPKIVTPNGDGINEQINFSFKLLQVTQEVPLRLAVFDLSGRSLRVIHDGQQHSGGLRFSWDGRDENGERVPPGLYVYRISVESEKGGDQLAGTVAVVY